MRLALADASPLVLNATRFVLATAALAPFLAPRLTRAAPAAIGRAALLGLVLAAAFAAQTIGLQTIPAGRSAFLTATYVLLTPVVALLLFRVRPRRRVLAGGGVTLAGLAIMTGLGLEAPLRAGDALTLAGALLFALHIVLVGAVLRRGDPPGVVLLVQLAACGLGSAVAAPLLETPGLVPTAALAGLVLFLGLVGSAGALALQIRGQRSVGPARTAVLFASEPLWAALFGSAIGDAMSGGEWLGGALVVAGLLLGAPSEGPRQATSTLPR